MNVHNHGPEEGKGLACHEQKIGECQLPLVIDLTQPTITRAQLMGLVTSLGLEPHMVSSIIIRTGMIYVDGWDNETRRPLQLSVKVEG